MINNFNQLKVKNIAILGRTNVGKSALFNRLINKRLSIVSNFLNTTRDSVNSIFRHKNKTFNLIDTAGINESFFSNVNDCNSIQTQINKGIKEIIDNASLILFVIDIYGITPIDIEIFRFIIKCNKTFLLVVSKVDNEHIKAKNDLKDFYKLTNNKDLYFISSIHNIGINDLRDNILLNIDNDTIKEIDYSDYKILIPIVGYPNVGKSSLFNYLIDYNKMIVDNSSGTTRDIISEINFIKFNNQSIKTCICDTPGIKLLKKSYNIFEKFGYSKVHRLIIQSDIVIFMIRLSDTYDLFKYDIQIGKFIADCKKPFIIVVSNYAQNLRTLNKKNIINTIHKSMNFVNLSIPIIFLYDNSIDDCKIQINKNIIDFYTDICILRNITNNQIKKIFKNYSININNSSAVYSNLDKLPKIYYTTINYFNNKDVIPTCTFFVNDPSLFNSCCVKKIRQKIIEEFNLNKIFPLCLFKKS